jgi:predicted MFS family arabinose efflux permease
MDRRRIAVTLAGAAAFVNLYAPQSLLPLLHEWLGQNAALAGLIVSSGTLGVALAAPFAGWLSDRFGRRRVIVAAAFAVVIPAIFVGLAQSPEQLIAARFIEGLFLPGIFAVTVAYAGDEWPADQSRAVTALYVAGTIGGGFTGRLVSGVVAEFYGWRWAFIVLAAMQLLLALMIRAWLPPERATQRSSQAPFAAMQSLLQRPAMRGAYLTGFMLLFTLVGGFTYITLRLARPPFGLGPAALSAIFVVYLVGMTITPLSGRLLNRYGHARVLALAWAIAIAGLVCTLLQWLPTVIAGLCLFSLGLFIAQTTATSFVAEAGGSLRAAAVGLYVTCYYAGGSVGGVLPAPIWDHAGWAGVVALLTLAGMISATVGWRCFRLPRPPAEVAPLADAAL